MFSFLFDIDDTVYDQLSPFAQAFEKHFDHHASLPLKDLYLYSRKFSDEVFERSESGEMGRREMHIYRITKAFQVFDVQITPEEALGFQYDYETFQKNIRLLPDVIQALDYCKTHRLPLGVITNGPRDHQHNKVKQLGLERWILPEHVFVSNEIGIAKPDKRIFLHAQYTMNLEPETTYYVGDSYANDVIGAKQAGWKAIWINRRGIAPLSADVRPDYVADEQCSIAEIVSGICEQGQEKREGHIIQRGI